MRVVKKGSNTRPCTSGGMPQPLSRMQSSISPVPTGSANMKSSPASSGPKALMAALVTMLAMTCSSGPGKLSSSSPSGMSTTSTSLRLRELWHQGRDDFIDGLAQIEAAPLGAGLVDRYLLEVGQQARGPVEVALDEIEPVAGELDEGGELGRRMALF